MYAPEGIWYIYNKHILSMNHMACNWTQFTYDYAGDKEDVVIVDKTDSYFQLHQLADLQPDSYV